MSVIDSSRVSTIQGLLKGSSEFKDKSKFCKWSIVYCIAGNFREAAIFTIFAIKRQLAKICSRKNFFLQKFLADELRTVVPSTCSVFKLSRRFSKSIEKLS